MRVLSKFRRGDYDDDNDCNGDDSDVGDENK